ncbi:MAG: LysM peptidoglycan-binding domain-containing protein, partial [Gammaproteobacteria bacterium]|nr:LysM peptidoglycan-binding domain-containing protein [Gammaproteobacteria bacterium]
MSRFLIVVDGEFKHDIANSGTDYIYTDMGQGEPGSVSQHTINPGDTLESISTTYFGSSAYWYLIAEANGIENSESLKPGTTLTIPG